MQEIDDDGKISTWPSNKKKWTQQPKKGWTNDALDYFDDMIKMENEDRRKYNREVGSNVEESDRVDVYNYGVDSSAEEGCNVDADEIINI